MRQFFRVAAMAASLATLAAVGAVAGGPALRATGKGTFSGLSGAAAGAQAPTVRASISQGGLDYVSGVLPPWLASIMADVSIPDQSFSKDSIDCHITSISCNDFEVGTMNLALAAPSLDLAVSGIGTKCTAHWSYKESHWPHVPNGDGSVDVTVGGSSAVSGGVAPGASNGKLTVTETACSANIDITDLHFDGGLSGDILNLFKDQVEDVIQDTLKDSVCGYVKSFVNNELNSLLASIPSEIDIPLPAPYNHALALNYSFPSAPTFGSGFAGIDVVAQVVDRNATNSTPFPVAPLPAFDSDFSDHFVQAYFGVELANSIGNALNVAGLLDWTIEPTMLPKSSPIQLNTTSLKGLVPGMYTKYPNDAVQVRASVTDAPFAKASPAGANVSCTTQFAFYVEVPSEQEDDLAFTLECPLVIDANASIAQSGGNESLVVFLQNVRCELALVSSQVGTVNVAILAKLVDAILVGIMIPDINKKLGAGLPLPTIEGVSATDSKLFLGNGFLGLASNFTFVPPNITA